MTDSPDAAHASAEGSSSPTASPSSAGASRSEPAAWRRAALKEALEHAAHLLPAQAPLHAFVHHNTLHAFEDLPFERAMEQAADRFGAEPYPTEAALARFLEAGSIEEGDVSAVIDEEFALPLQTAEIGGLSLRDFMLARLTHFVDLPSAPIVRYLLSEGLVTSAPHPSVSRGRLAELETLARERHATDERPVERLLGELWQAVVAAAPPEVPRPARLVRRRDQLLELVGDDADSFSIPHLIRLAAGYLDQGVSSWAMPEREHGFYHCFRELYKSSFGVLEKWLLPLAPELARQASEGYTAEDACIWALEQLSVSIEHYGPYVEEVLLALRGWAGMFNTVEHNPEKCPVESQPAKLVDFLAVALVLEAHAATYVRRSHQRELAPFLALTAPLSELDAAKPAPRAQNENLELAYEAFVLAQSNRFDLSALIDRGLADAWFAWVERLSSVARRRLLWRALERHHLLGLVRGMSEHGRFLAKRKTPSPKFRAIFCIDDREESYRRHLEEVEPGAVTYSYPGFFGVAMRFHGHGELRPRDLCPVVLRATHVIREVPAEEIASRPRSSSRGLVPHRHVASTTLVRGFFFSLTGVLSIVPLVLQVLFPRWFHARKKANQIPTELLVARRHEPESGALPEGYTDDEMTEIVQRLLGDIGLVKDFTPLVMVIGHGASSVNNPLLAAYGCGATAGGCGGPNARAVCAMANRSTVRARLRERGIDIPVRTVFVAGMHDTTTDDVTLYPEVELPAESRLVLEGARRALNQASVLNAHERCRLFFQVPTSITPKTAKAIVESRSADLAAARPEFNHAKNSCAIVGRRQFTRGLFLDKRAFLVSSDPTSDDNGQALERMIMGSVPVGMGINLEYFFATVDNAKYGSGSKLPHNVSGLMGIMNGHASDLQTGLNSQMVEPHEPIRLVSVVEATPDTLMQILDRRPGVKKLVDNGWIQLVAWLPEEDQFFYFNRGHFRRLAPAPAELARVPRSIDAYRGRRGQLPLAHVTAGLEMRA